MEGIVEIIFEVNSSPTFWKPKVLAVGILSSKANEWKMGPCEISLYSSQKDAEFTEKPTPKPIGSIAISLV